ncbi:MAG: hypothetical protein HC834_01880 [Rhodospirillales bacterium]|nr:hypothetical protein [Rhodospirillales bacterium]
MDISYNIIQYYLQTITVAYFGTHDMPPDDLSGYDRYVEDLRIKAIRHRDLDALRLGFEYLLAHPEINLEEQYQGGRYPFDDAELREIIAYTRSKLWPDAGPIPPDGPPGVRLVQMSIDDWWKSRQDKSIGDPSS